MLFETFRDEDAAVWRWRIVARRTRRVLAVSPDAFDSEEEAERTIEGVRQMLAEQLSHLDDLPSDGE